MGLEFENKLTWKLFKQRLLEKAERNMRAAMGMGTRTKFLSVKAVVGIWKALIRPVLEYAAEIWGEKKWEEAEILQRKMAKRILGLPEKTTNEAVLGDLGWWPLKARRDMIRLRYLQKILNMKQDRLPKMIYEWERQMDERKDSWLAYTKKLLIDLDLEEVWIRQEIKESTNEWNKLIEKKIQEREQREWRQRALKKPKLRTYTKYKLLLKEEEYLKNEDEIGRRMMARIRSGTNKLRIETGRYEKPKQAEEYRICKICKKDIENEEHFLHDCIAYDSIRKDLMIELNKKEMDKKAKEILFGKGTDKEIEKAIRYIRRAMAKRNRILEMLN